MQKLASILSIFALCSVFFLTAVCQEAPKKAELPPTLGLENGLLEFDTPNFRLKLVKDSQTLATLQPKNANGFDFAPADRLTSRAANGYHHSGDVIFSVRAVGTTEWKKYSTADLRRKVTALPAVFPVLARADLSATLPVDCPLQIVRTWKLADGMPVLSFEIKNKTSATIEIGAIGFPLVFNNMITNRSLKEAHEICSFTDPYIGQDAGYLQVTRLIGTGPALVVAPEKDAPFEAYQPLVEPTRPNQTFEGTFAWLAHSLAYAETDWKNAQPWNQPTSETLAPNQTRTFGVKFLLASEIRNIERTLEAARRPVAVGFPGYVLPQDIKGKLYLKYPAKVKNITVEPENAISFKTEKSTGDAWQAVSLRGNIWGRARVNVVYADGTKQAIHYNVIKPAREAVADLGNFLFTKQWYENPADPFQRSPSVMSYDREANKIVEQDSRVWIAGLGDEGGSGSWIAAGMKQFAQPKAQEIAKYERFIDGVLWGKLQYADGANKYGVRKSLFYYEPAELPKFPYDQNLDWKTWTSWNKKASEDIGRGYNYPHVVAAYWAMYRTARNHENLVKNHQWDWYLNQAYETTKFMFGRDAKGERRVGYVELGLMEGTIFFEVLRDLQREKWTEKAAEIEKLMKERADLWKTEEFPFGSEMAWDSTGQEEVYAWCKYFGYDDKAQVSLNSIVGYMPTLPHWGYNGNARRYWDFLYGGRTKRIERQLHHYGSGLNAIPVLDYYRAHPADDYLLRVGYGGTLGALTNIDREGFASAAFHSYPNTLKWDAYTGDYGPNFFGHAINSATYVIDHPEFGWQSFGGNVARKGDTIKITPLDSMRMRVYLASYGLWLTLDAGNFAAIEINAKNKTIRVGFAPATAETVNARLRIEQPAKIENVGVFKTKESFVVERDAAVIPLSKSIKWIELKAE